MSLQGTDTPSGATIDDDPVAALSDAELGRLVLDNALDYAIVTFTTGGTITSWSAGAEHILGWSEKEIIGQSADMFFTPEDRERNQPELEMARAADSGKALDERWHMRKDGGRFYAHGLMMPIRVESENYVPEDAPTGFLKIFRDHTDRLLIDKRTKGLEESVALALSASGNVGLHQYDVTRQVAIADAQTAEFFGLDPDTAAKGLQADVFFAAVHEDDVEWLRKEFQQAVESDGHLDVEYRVATGGPRERWVHTVSSSMPDEHGKLTQQSGMTIDVTAQRQAQSMQAALLELGDTLRDETDPDAMVGLASRLLGETMHATRAGFGEMDADGDTITIHKDWNDNDGLSIAGVLKFSDFGNFNGPLKQGQIVVISDSHDDGRIEDPAPLENLAIRSLLNLPLLERGRLKAVMFVNDSQPRNWSDAEIDFARGVFDRTFAAIERARFESERDLLNAELAHRMKNVLTMAQVVATQSLRHAANIEDGYRVVGERLAALGRAQEMLTHGNQQAVRMRQVIDDAMAPHLEVVERMTIEGPALTLPPQQVLGISLALHELATNAAKHGALSNEAGTIDVRWTHDADGSFGFRWVEKGGPAVEQPERRGFGSTILDRVTGGYFGGISKVEFNPEGVQFSIDGKLDTGQDFVG